MRRRVLVLGALLLALAGAALVVARSQTESGEREVAPEREAVEPGAAPVLHGSVAAPGKSGDSPASTDGFPKLADGEGWVVGRVVSADGTPCSDARVAWLVEGHLEGHDRELEAADADADGRFVLSGPRAHRLLSGPMVLQAWSSSTAAWVRVPLAGFLPGGVTNVDDLRLRADLLALGGRVVGDGDVPLQAFSVLRRERGQPAERGWDWDRHVDLGGEDGAFGDKGLPPGRYRLTVELGTRSKVFEHLEAGTTDLVLRVPDAGPLPQHAIRLLLRLGAGSEVRPTDLWRGLQALDFEGGRVPLEPVEGSNTCTLTCSGTPPFGVCLVEETTPQEHARWKPAWARGLVPREEPYEVVLEPGHVLRGRTLPPKATVSVQFSASGRRVRRVWHVEPSDQVRHTVFTDAEGNFEVAGLPDGEVLLEAWEGHNDWFSMDSRPPRASRSVRLPVREPLEIALSPAKGTRDVELAWPEGEPSPMQDRNVFLADVPDRARDLQLVTGPFEEATWSLVLVGLPSDLALDLGLFVPRVGWARLTGVLPGEEPLRVKLEAGRHLQGRVLGPDGRPAVHATVAAALEGARGSEPQMYDWNLWRGRTDEEGRFHLRPFGTGRCLVSAEDGLGRRSLHATAVIDGPPVELHLAPIAIASGRIVGVDPRKDDEYYVFVALPDGDDAGSAAAKTDGFFEVWWPGAVPATLIARNRTDAADRRIAVLEAPKTGGDGLQLVLRPGFTVTGRVVDAAGQPAADVTVSIRGRWTRDETTTGADGRFTCLPQPDDALELHVRAADGREVRRAVKPGEVELALPVR
jgi:hypothetical protein